MSRVIRSGGDAVVPATVLGAHEEARRIIADAHEEATRIRSELERRLAEEARVAARAELAAGYVALERARRAALGEAEGSVAALALAVARRLVGEELDAHPERVRATVKDAIDRVRRAGRVRVRVSPADAADAEGLGAEVVEDASIERGGCVVESDLGEVDARIEVRLEALALALTSQA